MLISSISIENNMIYFKLTIFLFFNFKQEILDTFHDGRDLFVSVSNWVFSFLIDYSQTLISLAKCWNEAWF